MRMSTNWKRLLILPLLIPLLAGCSMVSSPTTKSSENASLKVMFYDERSFYQQYGMLYSALYPEVDITVVTMQNLYSGEGITDYKEAMSKFIEEEQPDVLMLDQEQYEKMANDGQLYELDLAFADNDFNVEGIVPGLIDYVKELSGGKLYGMVSGYYSQVVYYNKDLFDLHGVTPPTDKMSWEELFQLARRFPTDGSEEERIYGLSLGYNSSPFQLGSMVGMTEGLNFVNPDAMQITIDTPAWNQTFESVIEMINSGALHMQNDHSFSGGSHEEYLLSDPFIAGKLAMKVEGSYLMNQLEEANRVLKERGIQNWDMVTMPVNPQNPDYSTNVYVGQFLAVNNSSQNTQAAVDFIKYIHSDEYARVQSKSYNSGNLSIRTQYISNEAGRNVEAFYLLKPSQANMYRNYSKLPQQFNMQFQGIAEGELNAVKEGQKSVAEALSQLQTQLQATLLEAKEAEQNQPAEAPSGEASESSSTDQVDSGSAEIQVESAPASSSSE